MLINKKANTGRWAGCRARGRAAAGPLGARALAGWGTWHRQVASAVWGLAWGWRGEAVVLWHRGPHTTVTAAGTGRKEYGYVSWCTR
jgi:hypothetical protein